MPAGRDIRKKADAPPASASPSCIRQPRRIRSSGTTGDAAMYSDVTVLHEQLVSRDLCVQQWFRNGLCLVGVIRRAASWSPGLQPYRRRSARGPDGRLEHSSGAALPSPQNGPWRLARHPHHSQGEVGRASCPALDRRWWRFGERRGYGALAAQSHWHVPCNYRRHLVRWHFPASKTGGARGDTRGLGAQAATHTRQRKGCSSDAR
jgi:hypothetical protein